MPEQKDSGKELIKTAGAAQGLAVGGQSQALLLARLLEPTQLLLPQQPHLPSVAVLHPSYLRS
jgi:hypothetical protein